MVKNKKSFSLHVHVFNLHFIKMSLWFQIKERKDKLNFAALLSKSSNVTWNIQVFHWPKLVGTLQ